MRLFGQCLVCQMLVRFQEVERLFKDESERRHVMKLVLNEMYRAVIQEGVENPAVLGTRLFRLIKKVSGNSDPYREYKKRADLVALQAYTSLRGNLDALTLDELVRLSAYANAMDLGVGDYRPPKPFEVVEMAQRVPAVGVEEAVEALKSSKNIVFILDNAGEVVFDRLLADKLRLMGKSVYAIVKSGAFQNDETVAELEYSHLQESFDSVVGSGTDAASLFLEEASREALELVSKADLVVAKGMANYEYLSENIERLKRPTLFLLVAKCEPIARVLGVERKTIVARLATPQKPLTSLYFREHARQTSP
ncbi:MAG TPA: DUF89 family protein [Pyrodictium sp.]|nr:DUF89 family protein [Pyrodictium sp.]